MLEQSLLFEIWLYDDRVATGCRLADSGNFHIRDSIGHLALRRNIYILDWSGKMPSIAGWDSEMKHRHALAAFALPLPFAPLADFQCMFRRVGLSRCYLGLLWFFGGTKSITSESYISPTKGDGRRLFQEDNFFTIKTDTRGKLGVAPLQRLTAKCPTCRQVNCAYQLASGFVYR